MTTKLILEVDNQSSVGELKEIIDSFSTPKLNALLFATVASMAERRRDGDNPAFTSEIRVAAIELVNLITDYLD